jgi:hypothetical protein
LAVVFEAADFDAADFPAGLAADFAAGFDVFDAADLAAGFAAVDFAAFGFAFAALERDAVAFEAAGLVVDVVVACGSAASVDFPGAGFAAAERFAAADFAAVVLVGFARDFAAGLRVPAARPELPDAVRAVRVVPGVAPPVLAPPARVPAAAGVVTSASLSSRRRRLPISEPAPETTLRPCSMAVSRMFLGVSGMR